MARAEHAAADLAGELAPLDGTVSLAPADAFVGWLPQEHERVPGETVAAYVARRTGCAAATRAMDAAAGRWPMRRRTPTPTPPRWITGS